jgi:hypothetical protein
LKPNMPIILSLTPQGRAALAAPITGSGGYQTLLRRCRKGQHGNLLVLSVADLAHLLKLANPALSGGWQARIRAILGEDDSDDPA